MSAKPVTTTAAAALPPSLVDRVGAYPLSYWIWLSAPLAVLLMTRLGAVA